MCVWLCFLPFFSKVCLFVCLLSRGVVVNMHWNVWSLLALMFLWMDVLYILCGGKEKQTNIGPSNFQQTFFFFFPSCQVIIITKYSRHASSLLETTFGAAKKLPMSFSWDTSCCCCCFWGGGGGGIGVWSAIFGGSLSPYVWNPRTK